MKNVTFENLPAAIEYLILQVENLAHLSTNSQHEHTEKLLTIEDAAAFLNLSKPTLYSYVHRKQIPFLKKSKRLYFERVKLLEWVKSSRQEDTQFILKQIGQKRSKGGEI